MEVRHSESAREGPLSLISQLRLIHFCYFSNPPANRPIYRAIRRLRATKIVELGIGDGRRTLRMIAAAKLASPGRNIQYVGFDRFEDQPEPAGPRLTLKAAHRLLGGLGVRARLVPGEPRESLIGVANSLGMVDLLVLPAEMVSPSTVRTWFFIPRMLHPGSVVLVERAQADGRKSFEPMPRTEIDALAAAGAVRRAA